VGIGVSGDCLTVNVLRGLQDFGNCWRKCFKQAMRRN
jgi:hypothetical protein